MKTLKIIALLTVLVGVQSFAGIAGSKHDLSTNGGGNLASTTVDEICVFCHTPHGSDSSFEGAPLWNKAAAPTSGYKMYGAAAVDTAGTTIASSSTGSATGPSNPSKACLSCHDGVSAINSIANAPGSGLYNADIPNGGYAALGTSNNATAVTMANIDTYDAGGAGSAGGITNIGTDLTNDHPISVTYTAGKASLRATTYDLSTTPAADFRWQNSVGAISTILRGTAKDKVECSTCHDPHLGPTGTGSTRQELFLRSGNNDKSKLCLGCHDK